MNRTIKPSRVAAMVGIMVLIFTIYLVFLYRLQIIEGEEIYNRVVQKTTNGSIILFHNAAKHTPEALPMIIEKLQKDGFEFKKISDVIYKKNYYIDNTGKQIKNK